jgi:glycosyltransferase involved in cell wall biosynthesis
MVQVLISIIVPVYNVEKYLSECLDSLINQTYQNIEIIIINDESPDNCWRIIEDYACRDSRIKYIHQKNTGLSGARNAGIKLATGDFLMFVDSDDWLDLETCEFLNSKIKEDNFDLCFWSYVREYKNKSSNKNILEKDICFDEYGCKELHIRIFGLTNSQLSYPEHADSIVTACMKLYKTSIINDNGLYFVDTKIIGTEDALFNAHYFYFVKKAFYIHQYFYHYRRDNLESLTTKNRPLLFNQWCTLFKLMEELIERYSLEKEYKNALNNRIGLSIVGLGINELNSNSGIIGNFLNLRKILNSNMYRDSYKLFHLSFFPLHWKIFFFFAKYNIASGVLFLLFCIQYFVNRNK